MTDNQFRPLFRPHPFFLYVEATTIVLTILSPLFALFALSKAPAAARELQSTSGRILLWLIVVVGFLVSLAESMWTCSGHPTWIQGYPY
jgi:hypothetical protein